MNAHNDCDAHGCSQKGVETHAAQPVEPLADARTYLSMQLMQTVCGCRGLPSKRLPVLAGGTALLSVPVVLFAGVCCMLYARVSLQLMIVSLRAVRTGLRGARCIVHDRVFVVLPIGAVPTCEWLDGPLHAAHRNVAIPTYQLLSPASTHARTHARTRRSRTEQEQSIARLWAFPVVAESEAARPTNSRLRCDLPTLAGGGPLVCVAR